ncbi:MAG: hypothetical protein IKA36_00975, partial [Clostridia bacterium]|nr:hypothetical protein [Clostridia bacterium]
NEILVPSSAVDLKSTDEILVPSSSYSVDINSDKKIIKFIPESFDSSLSFVAINSDTVEEIYMSDLGVEKIFLKTPNLKRFDAENGNLTNVEINENIEILNLSGNSQPITINEQRSYSVSFFIYENSPDLPKLLKYKPSFKEEMFKNIAPDYGEPNSFSFDYEESAIPQIYSVIQEPKVLELGQEQLDQSKVDLEEPMEKIEDKQLVQDQFATALNESEVDHEPMILQSDDGKFMISHEQSVIDLSEPMKDQLLVEVGELLKTIDNEQLVQSLVELDETMKEKSDQEQSDQPLVDNEPVILQSDNMKSLIVNEQSLIDLNESMKKVEELSNKFKEMIEKQNNDDCLESNIYDQIVDNKPLVDEIVDNKPHVDQDVEIHEPIIDPKKIEVIKPVTKGFLIDDVQLEMTNDQPVIVNDQPMIDNEETLIVNDQPSTTNDQPVMIAEQPTATNDQTVNINDQPLIIDEQSMNVNERPPVVHGESVISHIFTIRFTI